MSRACEQALEEAEAEFRRRAIKPPSTSRDAKTAAVEMAVAAAVAMAVAVAVATVVAVAVVMEEAMAAEVVELMEAVAGEWWVVMEE